MLFSSARAARSMSLNLNWMKLIGRETKFGANLFYFIFFFWQHLLHAGNSSVFLNDHKSASFNNEIKMLKNRILELAIDK